MFCIYRVAGPILPAQRYAHYEIVFESQLGNFLPGIEFPRSVSHSGVVCPHSYHSVIRVSSRTRMFKLISLMSPPQTLKWKISHCSGRGSLKRELENIFIFFKVYKEMDIITRTFIKKNYRESFFLNYHLSLSLIISLLKRRVSVSYTLYNIPGFLLLLSSYNIMRVQIK